MKRFLGTCALIISLCLSGCANSTTMNRFTDISPHVGSELQTNNSSIQEILNRKAQLPPNFRLAIYFQGKSYSQIGDYRNWSPEDKDVILNAAQQWEDAGLAGDIYLLSESLIDNHFMINIRRAAAQTGADALMIVQCSYDVETEANNLALTYPLILPTFLVPGTDSSCKFLAHVSVWDVRNEFLYSSFESYGSSKTTHPYMKDRDEKVLIEARHNAALDIAETIESAEFNSEFFNYAMERY